MKNFISLEKMPFLQFPKIISSINPLISSPLIRVIFEDGSETFVINNKRRGLIEPRKYRRIRLSNER